MCIRDRPHFMQLPKLIIDGKYKSMNAEIAALEREGDLGKPIRDYAEESKLHYHQFR